MIRRFQCLVATAVLAIASSTLADAADIKILTAGAMKAVVVALAPEFEAKSGHKLVIDNDTAGGLARRIKSGETFDVAIITPAVIEDLAKDGKIVATSAVRLAKVGIGVAVRDGAPKPAIGTVEEFKQALLAAPTVGYIDPKAGGSSGIYFDKLLEKLGIADTVRAKAKLKAGGYVAELVASGEVDLGIHQISEILPVKGVNLVGPLPAEIQNYTVYSAGVATAARDAPAAAALVAFLGGPSATEALQTRGLERP
jgi:molybdate transport system substrate-binding protein